MHVEAEWDRNDQVGETKWLQKINKTSGMPNAIVGHIWLNANNCEEVLYKHSQFELFRGVRSKPKTALTSDHTKPTGPGSMHDPNWQNGIAILEQMQLCYDLRVPYWHLYEAADILGPYTDLKVVLNHTGLPWDRSKNGIKAWRQAMKSVAACPNICVKISELGLKDSPWTVDNNRQVVLDAIDIFGVERCMWASNFPVASLRISYKDQLDGMLGIMSGLSDYDLQKIFFQNAIDFYKIRLPSND